MIRRFTLVAAAALAVLAASPARAQVPPATPPGAVPFSFVDEHPCTGEVLVFEGWSRTQLQFVANANRTIAVTHTVTRGVAVGQETGTLYLYGANQQGRQVLDASFNFEAISTSQRFRLVGPDPDDNAFLTLRYKLFYNGRSELVVELDEQELECR